MRRAPSRLGMWALVGLGVVGATFSVMVLLRHGQRLDFSAYEGRKWTSLTQRRSASWVMRTATPVVVVATLMATAIVAGARRGVVAAASTLLSVPVALVAAWTLKAVLPRPDLLPGSWVSVENTFPSGHVAGMATAMLMAVSVSPPAWRPRVAAVAVGALAIQVIGVSASGGHRTSDLVGALGLAVAVAAVCSVAVVSSWRGDPEPTSQKWYSDPTGVVVCLLGTSYAGLVWLGVGRVFGRASYGRFPLYATAVLLAALLAGAAVVLHARVVDSVDRALVPDRLTGTESPR